MSWQMAHERSSSSIQAAFSLPLPFALADGDAALSWLAKGIALGFGATFAVTAAVRAGETGSNGAESAADKVEDEDEDPNALSASRGAVENMPATEGPAVLDPADPFRDGKVGASRGRVKKSSNQLVLALGPGAGAA